MMHTKQPFTPADAEIMRKRNKGAYIVIAFIMLLLLVLGCVMVASNRYGNSSGGVWWIILAMAAGITLLLFPGMRRIARDREQRIKICGEFPVEKVIESGRYSTRLYLKVMIDNKAHKLQVKQEIYDIIIPREVIYLEFAPVSCTLLRMCRNGVEVAL